MGNYTPPLIGIVGKTNVGKTTFFAAATMAPAEISNRPFTTIEPNRGIGYVRKKCPHTEFNLPACNPKTGICIQGTRFIPIELIDVAGLIPGAHLGRGLGNKFMDDVRKADAFLLVVDASGSTDEEGNPVPPGTRDPVEEARKILEEIELWFSKIISKDWEKFALSIETARKDPIEALSEKLSGLSITKKHVLEALEQTDLINKKPVHWKKEEITEFARIIRRISKPHIIVANKADLSYAEEGIKRLKKEFKEVPIIPVSSQAELALKKASKAGLIEYVPGSSNFKVVNTNKISKEQEKALEYIRTHVLEKYGSTGVQEALETIIFNTLSLVSVYPVEDHNKLTDTKGNVLPDVFLVNKDATPKDVAYLVHSDFAKKFVAAIDVKNKQRIGESHKVYDGMVIKIISSA